jgi:hypothetical protein
VLYCRASLSAFYAPIGYHPTFSDIFDGFSHFPTFSDIFDSFSRISPLSDIFRHFCSFFHKFAASAALQHKFVEK